MRKAFYKKLLYRMLIVFMAIIVTGYLFAGYFPWLYKQFDHEPLWVSHSPDKRFSVASYAVPFLPFDSGSFAYFAYSTAIFCIEKEIGCLAIIGCRDCPGYIRLIDNRSGEILQEEYFGMLGGLSSNVDWDEEDVRIRAFAVWPLPER